MTNCNKSENLLFVKRHYSLTEMRDAAERYDHCDKSENLSLVKRHCSLTEMRDTAKRNAQL